jgi:hypothetical protein
MFDEEGICHFQYLAIKPSVSSRRQSAQGHIKKCLSMMNLRKVNIHQNLTVHTFGQHVIGWNNFVKKEEFDVVLLDSMGTSQRPKIPRFREYLREF